MIELLTNAEMAAADRLAVGAGMSSLALMENAGRAVAEVAVRRRSPGARICVVAGTGNNGGDGYVAARVLAEAGFHVRVAGFGDRHKLTGDAAAMAAQWPGAVDDAAAVDLGSFDLIIDGLFGAGLDRPVEGLARALIERINSAGRPVLAIDLPSGVNGTSGAVLGVAVRAADTVTFFRKKPGHLLLPGRLYCGRVSLAHIGIPASVLSAIGPNTFQNAPALWQDHFPVPAIDGHKYKRGHVVTVSGGLTSTGAARLAALAALRAGAGLSTIATPREALAAYAASNLALMARPIDGTDELLELLSDRRINAVVLGPGAGVNVKTRDYVLVALKKTQAVVLDADALTSFAQEPETLFKALRERQESRVILTPHEGEFSCIFNEKNEIPSSKQKLEKTRQASHETGAIVVLKGTDTVVACPEGRAAIAENAPGWLATAGSGDVLAGMIAGLRAQGMPPFEAACAGVWLHGEAGQHVGPGLIADDLPGALPAIYRHLFHEIAETSRGR